MRLFFVIAIPHPPRRRAPGNRLPLLQAVVLSLTRRAGRKTYITYPPFKRIDALATLLPEIEPPPGYALGRYRDLRNGVTEVSCVRLCAAHEQCLT